MTEVVEVKLKVPYTWNSARFEDLEELAVTRVEYLCFELVDSSSNMKPSNRCVLGGASNYRGVKREAVRTL